MIRIQRNHTRLSFSPQSGPWLLAVSVGLQAAALGQGSLLLVQALLMLSPLFALAGQCQVVAARRHPRRVDLGRLAHCRGDRDRHRRQSAARPVQRSTSDLGSCGRRARAGVGRVRRGRPNWGGALAAVLFAFVSGSLWGVFAVLTKEVMARLGDGGWELVRTPELYACPLVALGGVVWSQSAFRAGPLTASMPTLQISQPVVAAVLGVVVLDDTLNTGRGGVIALAVAAPVAAAAVVKLARVEAVATRSRSAANLEDPVDQPA